MVQSVLKKSILSKVLEKSSSENLKRASDVENILRSQINSKEKIISDLNETIKQYENQLTKYKNEVNEKSLTIVKLRNSNEDLETSFKNSLLKLRVCLLNKSF